MGGTVLPSSVRPWSSDAYSKNEDTDLSNTPKPCHPVFRPQLGVTALPSSVKQCSSIATKRLARFLLDYRVFLFSCPTDIDLSIQRSCVEFVFCSDRITRFLVTTRISLVIIRTVTPRPSVTTITIQSVNYQLPESTGRICGSIAGLV